MPPSKPGRPRFLGPAHSLLHHFTASPTLTADGSTSILLTSLPVDSPASTPARSLLGIAAELWSSRAPTSWVLQPHEDLHASMAHFPSARPAGRGAPRL